MPADPGLLAQQLSAPEFTAARVYGDPNPDARIVLLATEDCYIRVRDLSRGVNAGVRAARAVNAQPDARDREERGLDVILHAIRGGLALPAIEWVAVVGYGEFQTFGRHEHPTSNIQH